jgi:hypothetical protein
VEASPTIYPVLIGVGRPFYWPESEDLGDGATADVDGIEQWLRREYGSVAAKLVGPKATKAATLQALRNVAAGRPKEGDVVLLYFAGHGIRKSASDIALAVFDTAWFTEANKKNAVVAKTVLGLDDIRNALEDLDPGVRIEAIIDTCFAGRAAYGWAKLFRAPSAAIGLARKAGLAYLLRRLLGRRVTHAVTSGTRRVTTRKKWTLRGAIEDALALRSYVLWLSSAADAQSFQTLDDSKKPRGAFTLALLEALGRPAANAEARAITIDDVAKTLSRSKTPQSPSLAPSDRRLPRRPIFTFDR